ncbi:ribulose-phosphate 3-epimerase [Clostridium rectalis]|uniref:ribulose-phosphate 3-epimerase n=1 Tax=Clostridium rectalis TaxID=2040295 RepID=UPI000F6374F0|nr:ribulose-phosphate 3-epimerase [Clostridium rectalis]
MMKLAPSILSANFSKLGEEIKLLEQHGADVIHIDVMDGMFVPNISFGVPIIKSIRSITKLPFDVHLMIEEPSRYIKEFVDAGADIITVHYESDKHIDRTINYIKSFNIKAAIALNPGTPVSLIKDLIPNLDMVLIMSVNPGFGGQRLISYASDKILEVKALKDDYNPELIIEVDGGVDISNIKHLYNCGAELIVAGSAIFKEEKIKRNIEDLKEAIR